MAETKLLKAFHNFELTDTGAAKQVTILRFKVGELGPFEVKVSENPTAAEMREAMDRYAREFAQLA